MFSFKKFWHYSWGIVIRPTPTLKRLAAEPSLAYGFAAYFLFGLLYGLFSLVVYFSGHLPRGILVNFIPARTYYLWEAGFMIPVTMQIYILFAALAHLLSRLQRGQGSFEGTLSVLGFTYSIPLIILFWLPDVVLFFLFGSRVQLNFVPFYGTAAGLWTFIISLMGIRLAQQQKRSLGMDTRRSVCGACQAAAHAEALTRVLASDLNLSPVEIDEFWSFVQKKGRSLLARRRKASELPSPGPGQSLSIPPFCKILCTLII